MTEEVISENESIIQPESKNSKPVSSQDLGFMQLLSDSEDEDDNGTVEEEDAGFMQMLSDSEEEDEEENNNQSKIESSEDKLLTESSESEVISTYQESTDLLDHLPSMQDKLLEQYSINTNVNIEEDFTIGRKPLKIDLGPRYVSKWLTDVSISRGWKMKRKGGRIVYKDNNDKCFSSRFNALKHLLCKEIEN